MAAITQQGSSDQPARSRVAGPVGQFVGGVGLLGRGLGLYARTPRLVLLGLLPVAITAMLFGAALVTLLFFLGDLAAAVTWFATDWSQGARQAARVLAAIALLGAAVLLGIVTFTVVTLTLGAPWYERISEQVEQWCGGAPPPADIGFWRSLRYGLADSARLLAVTVPVGIVLMMAGFLPVVGQSVVPVLGAAAGGWFLAIELTSIPFDRRGIRLRERRRALRANRPAALGFGVAAFLCFLVPGGAVLVMPAAVAGGTLLARRVLGLPDRLDAVPGPPPR